MAKKKIVPADRGHGFDQIFPWSEHKHRILGKYLHVWVSKLGSKHKTLAFVDTCAGPGKYGGDTPGSPLIAARWNDDPPLGAQRGCAIIVHACEADPTNARQLRENLKPWMDLTPPRAIVYETDFMTVMPELLAATRTTPTVFFVDPFRVTDVNVERIQPLLIDADRVSTEVLVRVDPVLFARAAGWIAKKPQSDRDARTAATFEATLKRFNIDTEEIKQEAENYGDVVVSGDPMYLLGQYLELYHRRFKYVQLIRIRASYDAAEKYLLIHGTNSAHGAAHLNDVVSTTEDEMFATTEEQREAATGQVSLFGVQRLPRYSHGELVEEIAELLDAGPLPFIEIRAALARRFGPEFREKHHKKAVNDLLESKRVDLVGGDKLSSTTRLRLRRPRT